MASSPSESCQENLNYEERGWSLFPKEFRSLSPLPPLTLALVALLVGPNGGFGQDTLVVRADNPPVWGKDLRTIEEVRIGVLEGHEEYVFGQIAGVVAGVEGTIWVGDRLSGTLRRFDVDGMFLDEIGGVGEGPGEFKSLQSIETLPDDRIAAFDPGLGRVSFFDLYGLFVNSVPVVGPIVEAPGESFLADKRGVMYIRGLDYRSLEKPDWFWVRVDTSGAVLDTLQVPEGDEGLVPGGRLYGFQWMGPFNPKKIYAISPNGYLVQVDSERYALWRPLRDGRVVRIERSYYPISVKPEEREATQALVEHAARRNSHLRLKPFTVPHLKPAVWGLWIDQEGRYWLARHVEGRWIPESEQERETRLGFGNPPSEWWEPLTLDVIEPNGRFLGTVTFENRSTQLQVASGSIVWVVEEGEFGEQYVVRYRIAPVEDTER